MPQNIATGNNIIRVCIYEYDYLACEPEKNLNGTMTLSRGCSELKCQPCRGNVVAPAWFFHAPATPKMGKVGVPARFGSTEDRADRPRATLEKR
jgi:hypothetical protein